MYSVAMVALVACEKLLLHKRKNNVCLYYYPFLATILFLTISIIDNYLMTIPMIMMFFETPRRIVGGNRGQVDFEIGISPTLGRNKQYG